MASGGRRSRASVRARPANLVAAWCIASLGALLGGCATAPRLEHPAYQASLPAGVELARVPFHPQEALQCGPAAVATVLGAAGREVTPAALEQELFLPGRDGSLQPELVAAIRARGLVAYPLGNEVVDLLAELAAGRPVLVLQRQGFGPWPAWHYAVVVGYDVARDTVTLRSGTHERLELRAAVFEATWDRAGRWAIVALEPGRLPARPDVSRYVAAAAALEATGQARAAQLAYEAADREWPRAVLPKLGLANLAAGRGDWVAAERGYADVLRLEPGDAAALNNRSEAIARLGCPATARHLLVAGVSAVAPDDPLRPVLGRTLAALDAGQALSADPADCARFDAGL